MRQGRPRIASPRYQIPIYPNWSCPMLLSVAYPKKRANVVFTCYIDVYGNYCELIVLMYIWTIHWFRRLYYLLEIIRSSKLKIFCRRFHIDFQQYSIVYLIMLFIYSLHFVFDCYVHVCVCVGCKIQRYTTLLPMLCPDSFLHRKGGCPWHRRVHCAAPFYCRGGKT